jgi:hypothetical protein
MAGGAGFEPARPFGPSVFKTAAATQNLSAYPPFHCDRLDPTQTEPSFGRGGEIRTHDLLVPSQARFANCATPRITFGGAGGIRTHGRLRAYRLATCCLRPLGHCSARFSDSVANWDSVMEMRRTSSVGES